MTTTSKQDDPLVTPRPGVSTNEENLGATLSKRGLKRQLRRQKTLEERPAKRAAERARKKARKLDSKQNISNQSPLDQDQGKETYQDREEESAHHVSNSTTPKPVVFPSRVIFDCRFDEKMSEKEIVSLDRQIAHSYAINRRANVQFERLVCTSFNGRLSQRFETNGNQYLRWKSVKFTSKSIEDLFLNIKKTSEAEKIEEQEKVDNDARKLLSNEACAVAHEHNLSSPLPSSAKFVDQPTKLDHDQIIQVDEQVNRSKAKLGLELTHQHEGENLSIYNHNEIPKKMDQPQFDISKPSGNLQNDDILDLHLQKETPIIPTTPIDIADQHVDNSDFVEFKDFNKSDLVYLTADSKNVLTSIDPSKVYIIGSIVDHNRYKNLCLDLSDQLGINHAQLPIGEYFSQLKTRKVLTVNQVFEILVRFLEVKDWKIAFEKVIPSRKL